MRDEDFNRRNPEGYLDLTAYEGLRRATRREERPEMSDEERIARETGFLLRVLQYIIRQAGYEPIGRIALRHKRSGTEFY